MQVSRWGNSLAVRLPAAVVEALGLKEGDEVEIEVDAARRFSVRRKPDPEAMLARLRRHLQLKAMLEIWLYVHVPATFALIAALTAHIVSVFFFW